MKDGIFVSYSHQDSAKVEQIITTIRDTSGMAVWFDRNLHGGENYFSVIANQIVDNKYFVFISCFLRVCCVYFDLKDEKRSYCFCKTDSLLAPKVIQVRP